jgi:hypothetical protein
VKLDPGLTPTQDAAEKIFQDAKKIYDKVLRMTRNVSYDARRHIDGMVWDFSLESPAGVSGIIAGDSEQPQPYFLGLKMKAKDPELLQSLLDVQEKSDLQGEGELNFESHDLGALLN